MPKKSDNEVTYEALKLGLDDILTKLQEEDLDIDKALAYYQRGLELVQSLEAYLAEADNKVKELKSKFGTGK